MKNRIIAILNKTFAREIDFSVEPSPRSEFGHYSTNAALKLAKQKGKNPMELGEEIAELAEKQAPKELFEKITVSKPGFVNFWLSEKTLKSELKEIIKAGKKYGDQEIGKKKTIILEHSSLNIAKPVHVGHLRNAFLGDALANIYDALGYKTIRWDYLGDWGTQFGKLIAAYKLWGNKKEVEKKPIEALVSLYIRFHEELKIYPELEARGREEFRLLEGGNQENRELWSWFREESLKEFHTLYKRLNISFDLEIGESHYEKDLPKTIAELVEKEIAEESEGALIVRLDMFDLPPALVRKTDGSSLYITRDIANLKYRIEKYNPAKILYVIGNEQSLMFEQLFRIAQLMDLGYGVDLAHVKYGLVLDEGGKKFATREGRTIAAAEVIDKSVNLARQIVDKKNPDLTAKEKSEVAEAVGIGALKHTNLKEARTSDIVFNWEHMLDFTGDSGPYLQYTHARLRSILRKAGRSKVAENFSKLTEPKELELIRKMILLPETIEIAGLNLAPNLLVNYLHELSNTVNQYYETTPILKDENLSRRSARLALIAAAAQVLARGLNLLGITAPEKI